MIKDFKGILSYWSKVSSFINQINDTAKFIAEFYHDI